MKTFYSIINISPNPTAKESISVGLLLVSPKKIWVQFANKKMKIAGSLLDEEESALDYFKKQITAKVKEQNLLLQKNASDNELFKYEQILSFEYFEYLNVYNNNLLQFSKPVFVVDNVSEDIFNKLFSVLVTKEIPVQDSNQTNEVEFYNRIETKLIKKVESKVHTRQSFNSKMLPALYFTFEMDCIGLNGVFTGARSISFEKSTQTIDMQLSHYFALTDLLERKHQKHKEENNFYLIADEPERKKSKEHEYYQKIRQQDKFKVISSDESELVAEKIENTGAKKFLEEIIS